MLNFVNLSTALCKSAHYVAKIFVLSYILLTHIIKNEISVCNKKFLHLLHDFQLVGCTLGCWLRNGCLSTVWQCSKNGIGRLFYY